MLKFAVITLFPDLLNAFLSAGVIGRAVESGKVDVELINPRDFTSDIHRTVDDRPFGGGPGMVMKAEPLIASIAAAKTQMPEATVIYLSPTGLMLNQAMVRQWASSVASDASDSEPAERSMSAGMVLIAGRYEGIDERVIDAHVDAEISIGDFVLSGGEIAAMVVIDAVARLSPGVLGHPLSAAEDSFGEDGLLDHPHYTRPEKLGENAVPDVLTSGDHKAIATWRRRRAVERTWERRPDLLAKARLTETDNKVVKQLEAARDKSAT